MFQETRKPAQQRGRTLCWPSNATLMDVANWVTINLQTFSPQKSIFKQFSKLFTCERNPLYGMHKVGVWRLQRYNVDASILSLMACYGCCL